VFILKLMDRLEFVVALLSLMSMKFVVENSAEDEHVLVLPF